MEGISLDFPQGSLHDLNGWSRKEGENDGEVKRKKREPAEYWPGIGALSRGGKACLASVFDFCGNARMNRRGPKHCCLVVSFPGEMVSSLSNTTLR